jgi:hypothetical protein
MKKTLILLIFLPVLTFGQLMVSGGGSSLDLTTLLPIISDSTLWHLQGADTLVTDGALPIKVSGIRVSGTTRLDGTLTLITTAGEQVQLGTGSDAAPELSSAGDTDTGVRFAGGNKVQIVAGGVNSHTFRASSYTVSYPADGDTLGLSLDGTFGYLTSKAPLRIRYGNYLLNFVDESVYPSATDLYNLGILTNKWKAIYATDYIYVAGKGQSATITWGQQNIITEQVDSTGVLTMINGNPIIKSFNGDGTAAINHYNTNGQQTSIKMATVVLTIGPVAAATDTCLNLIPAGSMVIGVTTRVTTAVTGDAGFTGFSVGDGADADRWGANLNPAKDETSDLTDCTITSAPIYSTATSVILTQVGGSAFATGGVVRVTVHYISLTAPSG